jgi:hypothetical protein
MFLMQMRARILKILNGGFDRLVHPEIRVYRRFRPAFQVCGYTGLALAVGLAMTMAMRLGLLPVVIAALILAAVLTFFGLVMATKIITGEERIIYYHHEIVVMVVVAFLLWLLRQPILPYLDLTILGVGAFLVCGRLGCFMVGCCHGRPHRWGVRYRKEHADAGFTFYFVGVRLFATHATPRFKSGLRLSRCLDEKKPEEKIAAEAPQQKSAVPSSPPSEGWVRNKTPGGQKFGSGDIEGTYYIDASTTAKGQKAPAKGMSVIFQPNYVGAYANFSDKSKGSNYANGSGDWLWISHKYYKELTIAGVAAPLTPLDQWSVGTSGNFITYKVDFEDLPGIPVLGKKGIEGHIRRSYHIGVVCSCMSDPTKHVKGFLAEYSFNLDIWFKGSDVAVGLAPNSSYGGALDRCKVPPFGVACADACPAP